MATGTAHILIVEDDPRVAGLLSDYFKEENFLVSLLHRGDRVLPFLAETMPDLALLDIMLPGMDGIALCRAIKTLYPLPVILLTARVEEDDILSGFEQGADDYIKKPFSPKIVVARCKAVLKRSQSIVAVENNRIFVLDRDARNASLDNRSLDLTPIEYGILTVLFSHPGKVFSRKELVNRVQGYECDGYHRTIDTHIKNIRKKIAQVRPDADIIVSVYGSGYKLSLPAR